MGVVEDYIDLLPMLDNLFIDAPKFLQPIKKVEVKNAWCQKISGVEASGCIHIAQTVGIGSHPGSALLVLTEGEHGVLVQEMPLYAAGCYIK